jgi:hypothetical protein
MLTCMPSMDEHYILFLIKYLYFSYLLSKYLYFHDFPYQRLLIKKNISTLESYDYVCHSSTN